MCSDTFFYIFPHKEHSRAFTSWAEGVTQALEHLPSKCKGPSSNPHTTKKKKQ
jgi:hypothetical protein